MALNKRYVVGRKDDGKSDILIQDDWTSLPEVVPGLRARDAWLSFETPADLSGDADPTQNAPMRHEPPDGGSIFRVITVAPWMKDMTAEEADAMHRKINSIHVPTTEEIRRSKDVSMHKTDTLNYFYVAAGEVWMLTEERDVLLKAGDIVVQKGCMHGWRNEGPAPCTLIGVMIDARPLP